MLIRASQARKHVGAEHWTDITATDFWLSAGAYYYSTNSMLDSWSTNSLVSPSVPTNDFLSSADQDGLSISTNTAGDYLGSAHMFGDYQSVDVIQTIYGWTPTQLIAEFRARFSTASANETGSRIGFIKSNTSANTLDGASIYSNGTNFILQNAGGGSTDTGAAIDTNFHTWKIVVSSNIEWFIDGASQGTVTLTLDKWPNGFGFYCGTTNRFELVWAHVWYE